LDDLFELSRGALRVQPQRPQLDRHARVLRGRGGARPPRRARRFG
jgi:hypothetical protein